MKKKFIIMFIVINIITLPLFSQDDIPLNEIPMYGGDKITEYYKKINQDFINDIKKIIETKKQFKDLNEASKYSMNKGWDAFNNGDYLTSIKRFNQAWLLDPDNPDVYWGFGDYLGIKEEFEESIKMFYKYLELDPGNVYVMADLAKSYNMNGFKNSYEGKKDLLKTNLEKAIEIIEKAITIKKTGILYHHWAVSLFYLERYKEAKEKIDIAIKMKEKVDKNFLNEIDSKIK
jgi:tetratricopeptide (TPR) repeat protein